MHWLPWKRKWSAGQVAAKRLLAELYDRDIDRLQGKPHTAEPPPKAPLAENGRIQEAIQNLFNPKPSAEVSPS